MTTTEDTDGDTESRDQEFGGLLAASGVPVSDAETAELRRAFDTLCNLAARVRTPGRDWAGKPMAAFPAAAPRGGGG
ncbi:MAG: hypothetical protein CBC23_013075, partial [Rhodospirillaceae bacterium TMED63]